MNDEFFRSFYESGDPFSDGRSNGGFGAFGGMFREMDRMMRDMDRIVSSMHRFHDHNPSNFLEAPRSDDSQRNSLRDRMLKSEADLRRGPSDVDYDDRVAKYGVQSVLDPNDEIGRPRNNFSHFGACQSFSKVITSDGRVEERRLQQDTRGNKVETHTRMLGDKKYSVTRKQDPSGQVEENQNLYNLGEEDLPDFENQWKSTSRFNRSYNPLRHNDSNTPALEYNQPTRRVHFADTDSSREYESQNNGSSIVDRVKGWFKK